MTRDVAIGYLTVVDDERTGWTGGLLVLNRGGRPMEFQCTLPVRPGRTHQILFGATLRHHLIAEVIAPALLKRCRTPLSGLACDQPETLSVTESRDVPVALVAEAAEAMEGPIGDDTPGERFAIAGATFIAPIEAADAWAEVAEGLIDLPDGVEPFERIREAIAEAHSQLARAHRPLPGDTANREAA